MVRNKSFGVQQIEVPIWTTLHTPDNLISDPQLSPVNENGKLIKEVYCMKQAR